MSLRTQRLGFTLIELLLVIAMIGALTAIAIPMFRRYQIRSDLDNAAQQITQSLGRARILSVNGEGDSTWGVSISGAILFRGSSYALRDQEFDEIYPISSSIKATGLQEIVYSRIQGAPSATGTIVLTALTGERRTISIIIDKDGIPTTRSDRLTICHKPLSSCETKQIPDNAWPGHRGHGDYLGPCRC